MQKRQNGGRKEMMSLEEYIMKRKKMREEEKEKGYDREEKSPAWMLAELYG